MKKAIIFAGILIFSILYVSAQQKPAFMNIGLGIGPNYGGVGVKSVIGYNNSGLLLGAGVQLEGLFGYEIGGQISYKWIFINLGYGLYAVSSTDWLLTNPGEPQPLKGGIAMVGAMINLGEKKKVFLDIGIGYDWGGTIRTVGYPDEKRNFVDGLIGLGIRL
jgi:hypothetical protein